MAEKISVIICTKNRYESLTKCIESINKSLPCYPIHELIVVDSSDTTESRNKIQTKVSEYNGKYIFERRNGLSFARNTGITNATSEFVVFADDDFLVDKMWIKNLIGNYNDNEIMCVTGRMLTKRYDDISRIFEKSMSFDRGENKRKFSKKDINIFFLFKTITYIGNKQLSDSTPVPWSIGHGYCSFRKKIFDQIGYFHEKLGVGTSSLGGEEIEMFYRILKSGHSILYEPQAVIYHDHRQSYHQMLKAAYYAGASTRSFVRQNGLDSYLYFCLFGAIFLNFFAFLNSFLKSDKELQKMIQQELRGLLYSPKKGVTFEF